jgi:hypothetical protein
MSLRIRRGTESQRTGVTFNSGEIVWTTDLQQLWVGDGVTQGGKPVVGVNVIGYGLTYNTTSKKIEVSGLTTDDITQSPGANNRWFTTELAQDAVAPMFTGGSHTNIQFQYDDANNKINATVTLDGVGLTKIQDDTTPTLGGNLILNSRNISGTGNIDIAGSITSSKNINVAGQIIIAPISATLSSITADILTLSSTTGMLVGMPIVFSLTSQTASTIGSIAPYITYYIQSILTLNRITVSTTVGGEQFNAGAGTGSMTVTANGLDASIVTAKNVNVTSMLTFKDMVPSLPTQYQISGAGGYFVFGRASAPSNFVFNTNSPDQPFTIRGITSGFLGNQPQLTLGASRGTLASQVLVQNGDSIGLIRFNPYTGTSQMAGYSNGGFITAYVTDNSIALGDDLVDTTIAIGSISDVPAGAYTTFGPGGIVTQPVAVRKKAADSVNWIDVSSTLSYSLSTALSKNMLVVSNTGYTATLTFPSANLIDGQELSFSVISNTVTLALTAGPTLVGTFAGVVTAGTTIKYTYRASNTTWYKI